MIAFIKGVIYSAAADSVIIENNGIGYRVFVADPRSLRLGSEVILYTADLGKRGRCEDRAWQAGRLFAETDDHIYRKQ